MNELLSTGLWPRLRSLAKGASKKQAAVAYVTDDRFLKFGEGDTLVTDASDNAIASGQTSAAVLKAALKRKAEIVSITGLHAKVYVFDRHAIIGSANLSASSENRIEAALLTDQPVVVSASRILIESLMLDGAKVNDSFIERISRIPVIKSNSNQNFRKQKRTEDLAPRTWLVGLKPLNEKESESEFVEQGMEQSQQHLSNQHSEVSWIRVRGDSKFRREAKRGDVVVCIWTKKGKDKPEEVYRHAPILYRQDDPNLTRLFVEQYPDAEETAISWRVFQSLYTQIGVQAKLSQWAARELPPQQSDALHALWPIKKEL